MIKTVLTSPEIEPKLFTECEVLFREDSVYHMETVMISRVGNSLTWRYHVKEDGTVEFFRFDSHDYAIVEGTGPSVKPGDYIWFKANGSDTTWGYIIPPKNAFRRVFWEHGYVSKKELFHFGCTPKEIHDAIDANREIFHEERRRILKDVPESSWCNIGDAYVEHRGEMVAFADLSREWNQNGWTINGIYVLDHNASTRVANELLDNIKNHKGLVINAVSLRG